MVNLISFDRDINDHNTTVSVRRDSGEWTHDIELRSEHLRLLRAWIERNHPIWRFIGMSVGNTFLMVNFARKDTS